MAKNVAAECRIHSPCVVLRYEAAAPLAKHISAWRAVFRDNTNEHHKQVLGIWRSLPFSHFWLRAEKVFFKRGLCGRNNLPRPRGKTTATHFSRWPREFGPHKFEFLGTAFQFWIIYNNEQIEGESST